MTDLPGKEVQQWMRDAARESLASMGFSKESVEREGYAVAQIIAAHVPSPTPERERVPCEECNPTKRC